MIDDEQTIRTKKLDAIRAAGVDPYPARTPRSHTVAAVREAFDALQTAETVVDLVGRVRMIREHGKSCFATIEDASGRIQVYSKEDVLGAEPYAQWLAWVDIGDIVHVRGTLMTTRKGEQTVLVTHWDMLTKAVRSLPEKWHGLQNVEQRYRKRYLDLLSNPEVVDIFKQRSAVITAIRSFLAGRGYLEVETPILQPIYGGGFAKPFTSHHNMLDMPMYLRISNEMYLKRLVVGGFERVFEFSQDFRNESIDTDHNTEFLMLEAMTAYEDYKFSMDLVEDLYEHAAKTVFGKTAFEYQGETIELARPWKRMTMVESVKAATGVDVMTWNNVAEAKASLAALHVDAKKIETQTTVGECIALMFEEKVEETLRQPTIIYDYPVEVSPLAKRCAADPRFVERFEHFIIGMEHGNNYSELNDPIDLRKRFVEEKKREQAGFDEAHQTDEDFLEAIEHGMPPVTGIGIGIDRMLILLTNSKSIRDVILFPAMRPKGD